MKKWIIISVILLGLIVFAIVKSGKFEDILKNISLPQIDDFFTFEPAVASDIDPLWLKEYPKNMFLAQDKNGIYRNNTDVMSASFDGENITFTKDTGEYLIYKPYVIYNNIYRTMAQARTIFPSLNYKNDISDERSYYKWSANFSGVNLKTYSNSLVIGFKKYTNTNVTFETFWDDLTEQGVVVFENYTDVQFKNFTGLKISNYLDPDTTLIVNFTYDLRATDISPANWIGTTQLNTIAFDSVNYSRTYLVGNSGGIFGYYNKSDNTTYSLMTTDTSPADWIGTNVLYTVAFDTNNSGAYIGGTNGIFGYYNKSDNITYDLRATDANNWFGTTNSFMSLAYDSKRNGAYFVGFSGGVIGYYSRTDNVTYNLSATANWLSPAATLYSNAFDPIGGGMYFGGLSGVFGYYNVTDNTSYNLNTTFANKWAGGSIPRITSIAVDTTNGGAYLVGVSGLLFAYYNKSDNTTYNLNNTDTSNWLSTTSIRTVAFDTNNSGAYIGGDSGIFGYYNKSDNITYDLRATDVANWISTNAIYGVSYDPLSNGTYVAGANGVFGYYNKTVSGADTTSPKYSANMTNSTVINTAVRHSLYWMDDIRLSGYIFSFDNGTGTMVNDSWVVFVNEPANFSNTTKRITSTAGLVVNWCYYANDSSNNWNTSCANPYNYTTTTAPPSLYSLNQTNSSLAGRNVKHSLYWSDAYGLSGYIFSFDNGTGSFVNDSWASMPGLANWSNVTKNVNYTAGSTIRWCVYTNSTGNIWNGSSCASPFSYTTLVIPSYCNNMIEQIQLPFTMTANNSYYCVAGNMNHSVTAIYFTQGMQNTTLDCLGYNITGNSGAAIYGVLGANVSNSTVKNCGIGYFGDNIYFDTSFNNTIMNNMFWDYTNTSGGSINIINGTSFNISNNTFLNGASTSTIFITGVRSNYGVITNNTFVLGSIGKIGALASNNIVSNNTVLYNYGGGITVWILSNNNIIANNTLYSNGNTGIYLFGSSNNTVINNFVYKTSSVNGPIRLSSANSSQIINNTVINNLKGIFMQGYNFNSNITGNIFYNNTVGIYFSGENVSVSGGSIMGIDNNSADYCLEYSGIENNATNNFTNTNFTAQRNIWFADTVSTFNYLNDTTSGIRLATNISTANYMISRNLTSWSATNISWQERLVNVSAVKITYNLTGLTPNTAYTVYNGTSKLFTNTTGPDGNTSFTIVVNSTSKNIMVNTTAGADTTKPTFTSYHVNGTVAGNGVNVSIIISDETALSGYIFETNNTGEFINYTWTALASGGTAYNITTLNSTIGAVVNISFYANDSSNNWALYTNQITTTSAAQDTCTYSSGDWSVDCSDNCNLNMNTNIGANVLRFYGTGIVIINAEIAAGSIEKTSTCKLVKVDANKKVIWLHRS